MNTIEKRSKLRSLEDKLAESRASQKKPSERNEQARVEIEKLQEEREDKRRKMTEEARNETDLELETRELQAGEGRGGSNASQSTNGCCFNSTIVEQFIATGAAQAMQQFRSPKVNLTGYMTGRISQHQRRQYTKERSNQPWKEQEEIGTRSSERQRTVNTGPWRQRVATKGLGLLLFSIPLCSQIMVLVKGSPQQKETTRRQRHDLGRRVETGCCEWEVMRFWQTSKTKKNSQGKDTSTFQRNSKVKDQALFIVTARKRTQAPSREVAKVRASFHLEEPSGAWSIEEEMLMARYMSDGAQPHESERRNVGGRDGGIRGRKKKEHGERGGKGRSKKRKERRKRRRTEGNRGGEDSGGGARRGTRVVRKRRQEERGWERRI